jgi:tRNA nucleotidyltransferase/poly(A) polymerase
MRVNTPSCKKGYEIATYREDLTPGRKPVVRVGSTMEKDSMRRDFTINALYYDIENQMVLDPTDHGLEDLLNGLISTPGKPEDRMNEDKLRVLRAVRFCSRIHRGALSDGLKEAIKKDCKLEGPDEHGDIVPISRERIVEEFLKGIEQAGENNRRKSYVIMLHELGLLDQIFEGLLSEDTNETNLSFITSSECAEITIATILSSATPLDSGASHNVKRTMVDKLEFPGELSTGVKMLLDMRCVDSDTAYALRKYMSRTALTIKDLREFAHPNHNPNQAAFVAYVTLKNDLKNLGMDTNTGDQLMKEGFKPGPEMGAEQAKREADTFTRILDYMVQNDVKSVYPGITQYKK